LSSSNPFPARLDKVLAGALSAAGLILCLLLAWLPLEVSLSHFGFEDVFYYLGVARSLSQGLGATLDGVHPTNGFHPLWMLISFGLVSIFEGGSKMPVHLLFTLCAFFHVATALFIYGIVVRTGNRWVAVAALFLWLFNYNVIALAMCGLETALFGLLLIGTIAFYLPRREHLSVRSGIELGALLGLTALARFDGALLGFAVAADQLFFWMRRKEEAMRLSARVIPVSLAAVLLIMPWLAFSWRVSGAALPNSHRALKLWIGREAAGDSGILGHWLDMIVRYLPEAGHVYGLMPLWPLALVMLLALSAAVFRKPLRTRIEMPALVFVLYPIAHASYYAANFAPLNRYLYPAHLVIFTGLFIAAATLLKERMHERSIRLLSLAAFLVLFLNAAVSGVASWREGRGSAGTHSLHSTMYAQAVPWIQKQIPPDEKIGSFNCGIYSYFSDRMVVNLDGVINDSVIPFLEAGDLFSYLRQERIRYVIDWEGMLEFAFTRYGGAEDYRSRFSIIKTFEQPWGPHKGQRLLVLELKETS